MNKITKINENSYQWDIINPETDSLRNKVILEYDAGNKVKNLNWFNLKGEPLGTFEWAYNSSNHLTGYTYSRNDTVRGGMNLIFNEKGFFEKQEVCDKIT